MLVRQTGRRLVAAVLLLTLGACTSPPAPDPAAAQDPSSPAAPATAPPTPEPTGDPQQPNPGAPSTDTPPSPVGFRTAYESADGVAVKVAGIERTTAAKATKAIRPAGVTRTAAPSKPTGPSKPSTVTVKQGAALQVLTVRVANGTNQPLRMSPQAVMTYGPKNRTAAQLRGGAYRPRSRTVAAGASTSAKLAFAVPAQHIHQANLRLTLTPSRPPAVFSGSLGYTPGNSVLFNDPTGSKADQLRITKHIERSIDGAPPGSTIRIVQYSFDITGSLKKLLAAHERGVHIKMIVDQHDQIVTKQTQALIDRLGSNRKKKSFLIRCGASCMSNRPSTMHAKYYLFSRVGSATRVSMVGSANITHTNSKGSWNDMQTIVGDATVYNSLKRYFNDMAPDNNDRNYYRTTTSGPYTLYFFPRAEKHRVLLLEALDGVSCSGAAPGYGRRGKTVIQVTIYSWRLPRIDIARKLWRLHDAGCVVEVILNRGRTDLAVKQVLARRSDQHGVLDVHDGWVDRNGNNVAERYMHQKGITISGVWNGRPDAKVVYSGSQNFAPLSTTDNNELVLRRIGDATYDAYAKNFRYTVRNGTRRLY